MIIAASVFMISFALMEGIAWLTHKYIMHGLLWGLHRDHHNPTGHTLEKNDLFFVVFALPGVLLIYYGTELNNINLLAAGGGITLYGLCYFFIHDLFIHQRLKVFRNTKNPYLLALRRAHKMHHKHLDKRQGECFGMLFVPLKYFRQK